MRSIVDQVAMRALGFDVKKAEVHKLLLDHDKQGNGLMDYDDYFGVSMCRRFVRVTGEEKTLMHGRQCQSRS